MDVQRSAGELALAEARRHLGYREEPPGSNRTRFGSWFGLDGVPWCAIFVSYCFEVGAGVVLGDGRSFERGVASVPQLRTWLRDTGRWLGPGPGQPGDLVLFDWDGGVPDHVGLVEHVTGPSRFVTIEGNTGIGHDSDGGEVMRRTRSGRGIVGFGRV
jgi:hypothetical protein